MRALHQYYADEDLVVIEKPAGILVHPPTFGRESAETPRNWDLIRILRHQYQKKIYPVHRLDRATSGIMVFAFNTETAAVLQNQFKEKNIKKEYFCLVRGWIPDQGLINEPLSARLDGGKVLDCLTHFESVFRFELKVPSGKFETSRFSMVKVNPETGRLHQIRRHFRKIAHPLIGDTVHGDGHQNRIWRELTKDQRLYLKATRLEFSHPNTGENLSYHSRWNPSWRRMFEVAGFVPLL